MPSRSRSSSSSRSRASKSGSVVAADVLSSLVAIAVNAYLLNYVLTLEKEKCECSKDWQREYIKYFSIAAIVVSSVLIIVVLSGAKLNRGLNNFLNVVRFLLGLASLVNIFVLYNYSTNLIKENCECSNSPARVFAKYYSMIIVGLIVLALLISIISSIVRMAKA
jgi:hypothetical protein